MDLRQAHQYGLITWKRLITVSLLILLFTVLAATGVGVMVELGTLPTAIASVQVLKSFATLLAPLGKAAITYVSSHFAPLVSDLFFQAVPYLTAGLLVMDSVSIRNLFENDSFDFMNPKVLPRHVRVKTSLREKLKNLFAHENYKEFEPNTSIANAIYLHLNPVTWYTTLVDFTFRFLPGVVVDQLWNARLACDEQTGQWLKGSGEVVAETLNTSAKGATHLVNIGLNAFKKALWDSPFLGYAVVKLHDFVFAQIHRCTSADGEEFSGAIIQKSSSEESASLLASGGRSSYGTMPFSGGGGVFGDDDVGPLPKHGGSLFTPQQKVRNLGGQAETPEGLPPGFYQVDI